MVSHTLVYHAPRLVPVCKLSIHLSCKALDGVEKDGHILPIKLIVWITYLAQCTVALLLDVVGSTEYVSLMLPP